MFTTVIRVNKKPFPVFSYMVLLAASLSAHSAEPAATTGSANGPVDKTGTFIVSDEVREREVGAGEDPMAQQQSELVETPEEVIAEPDELRLYGSCLLYTSDAADDTSEV